MAADKGGSGNTLIVLSMVLIVTLVAGAVFVKDGFLASKEAPVAVELEQAGPMDGLGRVAFTLTNASPNLKWSDVSATIGGKQAGYDAGLLDSGVWCVRLGPGRCVDPTQWNNGNLPVRANQTLVFRLESSGGKVALVHRASEAKLWEANVKSP